MRQKNTSTEEDNDDQDLEYQEDDCRKWPSAAADQRRESKKREGTGLLSKRRNDYNFDQDDSNLQKKTFKKSNLDQIDNEMVSSAASFQQKKSKTDPSSSTMRKIETKQPYKAYNN